MTALGRRIAALVAAQGPISIAHYMALALHDAEGGYYATRDPFGAKGDFITAPEVSQMFGEMLGLWCVQAWADQGRPKNSLLVELGPGRGTLMADVLRAAKVAPDFLAGLDVVMVEASPVLQQIQREKLKGFMEEGGVPIRWVTHFEAPEKNDARPLFLLANEFFDALPIRQYVKTPRGWCERMVVAKNDDLDFALAPIVTPASALPPTCAGAPDGGVHEVAPGGLALAEEIARVVAHQGGAALFVDYGYDHAAGFGETLQAIGGHAFTGVLADPGDNDLSAHVDFGAIAAAGKHGGAAVFGPRAQGEFLGELGLTDRAEQLMKKNPAAADSLHAAVKRLIHPQEMGTLFKALAFLPPSAGKPPGF